MTRILLEKPVRFARGFASFIVEPLVRAPKARAYERFHNRFESSGDSPSAADSRRKVSSFGRGLGSLSNSSQRSSSSCESSRSLLSTARRSASLSFGSSLMISDALTVEIIIPVGNLSGKRGNRKFFRRPALVVTTQRRELKTGCLMSEVFAFASATARQVMFDVKAKRNREDRDQRSDP